MSALSKKLFYSFIFPGGLICAAALLTYLYATQAIKAHPVFTWLPLIAMLLALFIGWRFNRGKIPVTVILVYVAYYLLSEFEGFWGGDLAAIISTLLPLNFALLAFGGDRGVLSTANILKVSFIALETGILIVLHRVSAGTLHSYLTVSPISHALLNGLGVTQVALASFLFALLLTLLRFIVRGNAVDAALFWGLAALFGGLLSGVHPLFFSTASLTLVAGMVEGFHFLAFRDELTSLPTRRAFNEALAGSRAPSTIAIADIDHFKKVNDRYGHDVGDQVLKMVSSKLSRIGGGGRAFRYGGEEFAVIFQGARSESVADALEELRSIISSTPFVLRGLLRPISSSSARNRSKKSPKPLRVTISIGYSELREGDESPIDVVKRADKALYRSKKGGRNRVTAG
ncbi:MAG: hypothetical protein C0609_01040 [Deltaproteobacteria bacterium]|nr:MAG: hypothetical protein C0609_01040 [Deltaproteobacteria bacterium]